MPSILITGVSSGIGHACANLYAKRGWSVTGTLRDIERRPIGLDDRVELEQLDLGVPGAATQLAARILAGSGCPDVLLNNAGQLQFGPLERVSNEELERLFQVNLFGQLELIRALVPAMRERGSGVIANVSSLGGTMTFPFFSAYNATKWALEGASEGLWHELLPFGIRVKVIEPGFVETAIWGKALGAEVSGTAATPGADIYRRFTDAMRGFEKGIKDRTAPEECAVEIAGAIDDDSHRLRYPVAAYARSLVAARRLLGGQTVMRFFHRRWMGADSGR